MTKFIWRGVEDGAIETRFLGRKWVANLPQEVDPNKFVTQLETVRTKNADGRIVLVTEERNVSHVELLRRNPCFDEVGKDPKEHTLVEKIPGPNASQESEPWIEKIEET